MANNKIYGCTFHHVALGTSDFERSLKFYTEGLGFTVYKRFVNSVGKNAALIDIGEGSYFEIFSDCERKNCQKDFAGNYFHLALKVDNARQAYARAVECGAEEMNKAPKDTELPTEPPMPVTIGFVKGPDGEEIEFFEVR